MLLTNVNSHNRNVAVLAKDKDKILWEGSNVTIPDEVIINVILSNINEFKLLKQTCELVTILYFKVYKSVKNSQDKWDKIPLPTPEMIELQVLFDKSQNAYFWNIAPKGYVAPKVCIPNGHSTTTTNTNTEKETKKEGEKEAKTDGEIATPPTA